MRAVTTGRLAGRVPYCKRAGRVGRELRRPCARRAARYGKLVYEKKARGEQTVPLLFAIGLVHAFSESVGFASMLCATILSDNSYSFITAVVTAFVMHLLGRHGWMRYALNRALGKCGLSFELLRPSAITKLHDEVKFSMGYPRFITVLGLLLSNALRGKPLMFNEASIGGACCSCIFWLGGACGSCIFSTWPLPFRKSLEKRVLSRNSRSAFLCNLCRPRSPAW